MPPEPEADRLLSVSGLSVRLGDAEILRAVSFDVRPGEAVSIIGPNGAGKTTLLKTLLALHSPASGTLLLGGKPLSAYAPRERARWMAYVPQQQSWSDYATVKELVSLGRYPYLSRFRQPTQADREAVREAFALTGCESLAHRSLSTLSGGERQKVMISAALAQQPRLLLLDEPVTFLDPRNQLEIHALLRRINRETGLTLISVTHDLNAAIADSSRFLALRAGTLVFDGDADALLKSETLSSLYGVPFRLLSTPIPGERLVYPQWSASGGSL